MVGDGDWFREGYKRREIGCNHFDTFADFDGDGDLDLFKGGVETYVYCYENVGGNHYVERGKLTNDGKPWSLPQDKQARSWVTVEFCDWDGDGDMDFFPSFAVGYSRDIYKGNTWIYENTTKPGGPLTFTDRGALVTESGKPIGVPDDFAGITFVDLDGDGKRDVLEAKSGGLYFHKNTGPAADIANMKFADAAQVKANGVALIVSTARFAAADVDSDGDYDLFCGSQHGHIYWFQNVGTKTKPVFAAGREIINFEYLDAHSGIQVKDFDGDGLLDIMAGRYWERTRFSAQPRFYGRLYKNVGTKTHPRFEARDADHGAPHTLQFQKCDAVRQNRPRTVDWNNDGRMDLVVGDCDGFVWYFRNTTDNLFPVFATGEKMMSEGKPVRPYQDSNILAYAKVDVADWNNDGKKDLFAASYGKLKLFLNEGADEPKLGPGTIIKPSGDAPNGFDSGILACDWNDDGKKDLVGNDGEHFYVALNTGTDASPELAPAKMIPFGPDDSKASAYWQRPNAGSFVDWDGDGKKDFIMAEFEHQIRFLKNAGTSAEPVFADPMGTIIVQPVTGMLVSGADAKDFNGDGDLDIITGQGHGGSGIRYFDRDYINDWVNKTAPVVTVGEAEKK